MEHIRMTHDGPVGVITIDRRQRFNSLDVRTARDLRKAGLQMARDGAVRAVVLRGSGGVFCSGADLKYIRAGGDEADLGGERAGSTVHPRPTRRGPQRVHPSGEERADDAGKNVSGAGCRQSLIAGGDHERRTVWVGDHRGRPLEQDDGATLERQVPGSFDAVGPGTMAGEPLVLPVVGRQHGR